MEYESMPEEMDGAPSGAVATEMKIQARTASELSAELVHLLEPPRLLPGENVDAYTRLTGQIRSAVAPETIIEELLVRDITHLTWEILRLRRLQAELVATRRSSCLFHLAEEYLGGPKA